MDTTWFAVDQDGNVARFESGESGAVPAAAMSDDQGAAADEVFDELPKDAVFVYEHTTENWISGPYERTTMPARPLKVDAVPEELLENAIRYEGRFAETQVLQPASLWRCESWQPGWLAMDLSTVRPFEGREDELEEMREDLVDYADDHELVFLPDAADAEVEAERLFPRGPERPAPPMPVHSFDDVPKDARDDDWSDVMPESAEKPKKPWWKLW